VIARVLTAALLLLLLGAAAGAAALTREEALAGFAPGADPEARRRGVVWLAEHGTMSDLPRLAAALRDGDPGVRTLAEGAMWQVWSRSGDDETDRLFAVGLAQMSAQAGPAAVKTFSEVIARRPDFAEAWNKRATLYFLMGENEKSLHDCDEVMKRNPAHFGALAGYGQIYLRLDQPERALTYFRRALRINPNMRGIEQVIPEIEQLLTERRKGTI
jgi:tetratricopeptide (TPR) repeat protein